MKMREFHLIIRLTRVVLLSAMGFGVMAGAAVAHEAHRPANDHQTHIAVQAAQEGLNSSDYAMIDVSTPMIAAARADHDDHGRAPCSERNDSSHSSGNCCTATCHPTMSCGLANMPLPIARPTVDMPGLTDVLIGLASGRTERPPRRG